MQNALFIEEYNGEERCAWHQESENRVHGSKDKNTYKQGRVILLYTLFKPPFQ